MAKPDVIAAIATGHARAAIGVVRLSGPDLTPYVIGLLGHEISPRSAVYRDFLDSTGNAIDSGIALFFSAPHSFTGEDVLELQAHGGAAVLQLILQRCLDLGARLAKPGEFSERAYLNGKVDLAQAEAIADLIDAASGAAARAAVRSLRGEFSREVEAIARDVVEMRALIEAYIDFPEEEIEAVEIDRLLDRLATLITQVTELMARARSGKLLRDGVVAVLSGPPNVGKSSLINRLAEEEVAIVTEIPGTTRDAVSTEIVIRGVPVRLVDTAGLRDSEDPVERLGIERAKRAIEEADVILRVEELEREPTYGERPSDHSTLEWRRSLRVINKIDLKEGVTPGRYVMNDITVVNVSAKTGAGMDLIKDWVLESVGWGSENQGTFLARERHLRALQRTLEHVMACGKQVAHLELLAEELRLAQEALGEITGKYTSDDLLGEIFSRFCIGK